MMLINEGNADHVLLGGIDEITEESWLIKTRLGYFKKDATPNLKLLKDEKQGALAGESASFFSLSSQKNAGTYASISGVETFFNPADQKEIHSRIISFLAKNELDVGNIDLVIMGYNGDKKFDEIYNQVGTELFKEQPIAYYKHLCGEHDASSAFALWIASRILKSQTVPDALLKRKGNRNKIGRVLIYNQFRNVNHSLILLEKA
jgi:3-oxoacyl-(acyl-carrier-protein) synthase